MASIKSVLLIQELRYRFGTIEIPCKRVSGNVTSFLSAEIEQLLTNNGIRHMPSAAYHPETNGEAERMLHETKQALSKAKT